MLSITVVGDVIFMGYIGLIIDNSFELQLHGICSVCPRHLYSNYKSMTSKSFLNKNRKSDIQRDYIKYGYLTQILYRYNLQRL